MSFIEEIRDSNVSAHAKIVAITICSFRNRKTGECYPSLQLLSETLQLSQNTIQKCLKELEAEKIIEISKIRKFTSHVNSYKFLTQNKALPKVDTSNIDVSKNDISNIDTSVDTSVDTSNHTSKFDYKPIEPKEPIEPIIPPTPLLGDSGGVCLLDFYKDNCKDKFRSECLAIARGKKFSDNEAEKHFVDFENYWLSPALPNSKANKKNWQRAFLNWIIKSKPSKVNNFDVATEILVVAKRKLDALLDYENEKNTLDSNLVFLKALKNYTKQQIYNVLADIINSPPKNKIYSWGIINQYL